MRVVACEMAMFALMHACVTVCAGTVSGIPAANDASRPKLLVFTATNTNHTTISSQRYQTTAECRQERPSTKHGKQNERWDGGLSTA
jgi:hypothetical protein